ncbi:hypothetical protein [Nakamurella sp. PAMC28650]|uniref:hypothetical protein n=1 Tax=Nakamurella sp. PAMC28650 TaxID=2762325 RepID=UPI00164E3671|nr:hypothetical protein [Nakamurella sp. PAMC28650]QNK80251.1 hypothetical protein H7F38_18915 [Nakamurella sp. PAMC28650]
MAAVAPEGPARPGVDVVRGTWPEGTFPEDGRELPEVPGRAALVRAPVVAGVVALGVAEVSGVVVGANVDGAAGAGPDDRPVPARVVGGTVDGGEELTETRFPAVGVVVGSEGGDVGGGVLTMPTT